MSRSGTALQDLRLAIVALEGRIAAAASSVAPTKAIEHLAEWRKAVAARLDSGARSSAIATKSHPTPALPDDAESVPPVSSTRKHRV